MKIFKYISITTVLILLVGLQLNAQEGMDKKDKELTQRKFLTVGTSFADFGDLNSSLSQFGYPELSENTFLIGASGYKIIKKLVHGAEVHAIVGDRAEGTNNEVSLTGISGKLDFGYMIFEPGNLDVFPHIGFGVSSLMLNIDRDMSQASFDDVMLDPDDGVNLYRTGFIADIGINLHYSVDFMKNKEGIGNMVFGFSAGYIFDPFDRDWVVNGEKLTAGPELSHNNLYIKITIGKEETGVFPKFKK
ncbi:MAG: hypothetical protein KQH79_15055 [Bacteroidetes bacterium]|nr:hypothetical protein [Bacteroidota bacterium]